MKNTKTIKLMNAAFTGISLFGLASVSLMSIYDPQATMNLVGVQLNNTDALSSIRGVYGGVGFAIICSLSYLAFTQISLAIRFLTLFWGCYAISRLITILVDGPLGNFGTQ